MPPASLSEEAEPDYFIVITQKENYTVGIALPFAPIYRRDCNDLGAFRDESQQVLPGKIFRDGITDQISDLSIARFAIAFRHLLVTAPLAILRIEAGPRVGLIEILRIGAAHLEVDVLHVPVIRIAESEDHVIIDLAPFRWRRLLRSQAPLSGLIENLRTATRKRSLLSRFPPQMLDVEPRLIRLQHLIRRACQFEESMKAIFAGMRGSVFPYCSQIGRASCREGV